MTKNIDSSFIETLSRDELIQMFKSLLGIALERLHALSCELDDAVKSGSLEGDLEKLERARTITSSIICINDIIHPAFDVALELFPKEKTFIKRFIDSYKWSLSQGLVPSCICRRCQNELSSKDKDHSEEK